MKKEYKLCYVEGQKAWFTDNFEKQWGDDWNDKPYECNAGEPYDSWSELIEDNKDIFKRKYKHHPIELKTLYFETDDWNEQKQGREDVAKQKILDNVHNGAIILLHGNSKDNTNVLDYCIKEIKNMGYEFKNLDEFEK